MKKIYSIYNGNKGIYEPINEWNVLCDTRNQIIATSDTKSGSNAVFLKKDNMKDSRFGIFFDNQLSALIYKRSIINKELNKISKAYGDICDAIKSIKEPINDSYIINLYKGDVWYLKQKFDNFDDAAYFYKNAYDSKDFTKIVIEVYENDILVDTHIRLIEEN